MHLMKRVLTSETASEQKTTKVITIDIQILLDQRVLMSISRILPVVEMTMIELPVIKMMEKLAHPPMMMVRKIKIIQEMEMFEMRINEVIVMAVDMVIMTAKMVMTMITEVIILAKVELKVLMIEGTKIPRPTLKSILLK